MDLLNSYDDDEAPPVTYAESFVPLRSVNAGWFYPIHFPVLSRFCRTFVFSRVFVLTHMFSQPQLLLALRL
jgi:hypothetical protein